MQKENLNIYNIGSGKSFSARDIINIISTYFPSIHNYVKNSGQKILIQDCICDNTLFERDFNWRPTISLEDGIAQIIKNIK
jgi:nucleoside-diphosphate-sugar epimerase